MSNTSIYITVLSCYTRFASPVLLPQSLCKLPVQVSVIFSPRSACCFTLVSLSPANLYRILYGHMVHVRSIPGTRENCGRSATKPPYRYSTSTYTVMEYALVPVQARYICICTVVTWRMKIASVSRMYCNSILNIISLADNSCIYKYAGTECRYRYKIHLYIVQYLYRHNTSYTCTVLMV